MKHSARKRLRWQLCRRWKRACLYSDSSDEEGFGEARASLESSRYLCRAEVHSSQEHCVVLDALLDQKRDFFRQQTRMCQESFLKLLHCIHDDPIFHNDSKHKQRHPGVQLYTFLQVMGHDGNGLCNVAISGHSRMGEGTVSLYLQRVTQALLRIEPQIVKWPRAAARKAMSARFFIQYGMYCVGILDGTFVYFNQAPSIDPHNFFTRKRKMYGLNVQLICDLDWRIIGYVVGWPGCTTDTQAYETSQYFVQEKLFFAPGQCVLADKGYTPRLSVCVPYDEPEIVNTAESTADDKALYNEGIKKGRLLIERVNAMLKNRFTWLKGIRFQVRCREDFEKCNSSIIALFVVHNFMMQQDIMDLWSDIRPARCDEWADSMSEQQANVAHAVAKAASVAKSTMREQELLSRVLRMQQFIEWQTRQMADVYLH
jgi:hypothetical protein